MQERFNAEFFSEIIDARPLAENGFLKQWCALCGDFIKPRIIDRNSWLLLKRKQRVHVEDNGEVTFLVPADISWYEMTEVIDELDKTTCADRERRPDLGKVFRTLGRRMELAGIYIGGYIDEIDQGKELAVMFAKRFCEYGRSLKCRFKAKVSVEKIKSATLTPAEKQEMDIWLLGDTVYQSRLSRLARTHGFPIPEGILEGQRRTLVSAFFASLARKPHLVVDNESPWRAEGDVIWNIHNKVARSVQRALRTPEIELLGTVLRDGVGRLAHDLPSTKAHSALVGSVYGVDAASSSEKIKLHDVLEIKKFKRELALCRAEGNIEKIAAKELQISHLLQEGISAYPFSHGSNYPASILQTQHFNCVGRSILGSNWLKEIGIRHLLARIPGHILILIVTSQGKVYWHDLQHPETNYEVQDYHLDDDRAWLPAMVEMAEGFGTEGMLVNCYVPLFDRKVRTLISPPGVADLASILSNYGLDWKNNNKMAHKSCQSEALKLATTICPLGVSPSTLEASRAMAAGNCESAIPHLQQAIYCDPDNHLIYLELGEALSATNHDSAAITALREAKRLNPDSPRANMLLGTLCLRTKRYDEAVESLEIARSSMTNDSRLVQNLGKAYFHRGNYARAIKCLEQAVKLDPKDGSIYVSLGRALARLARVDEAVTCFMTALRLKPTSKAAHFGLGLALRDAKRREDSILVFEALLKLPGNKPAMVEDVRDLLRDIKGSL